MIKQTQKTARTLALIDALLGNLEERFLDWSYNAETGWWYNAKTGQGWKYAGRIRYLTRGTGFSNV